MKGYLYGEPKPPALVDSIDDNSEPGSPEEKDQGGIGGPSFLST